MYDIHFEDGALRNIQVKSALENNKDKIVASNISF